MSQDADPLQPPFSNVFDGEKGMRGYRINKLAQSMRHPENRKAFLADERATDWWTARWMTRLFVAARWTVYAHFAARRVRWDSPHRR